MTGIASLFQTKRGNPRGNPNNPGFVAHLKKTSDNHAVVRELLLELMLNTEQPMTAREIRELALQSGLGTDYKKFDSATVRGLLLELVHSGLVVSRTETLEERKLRADYKLTTGQPAALYYPRLPGVSVPPARTECVVVPGVYLAGVDERKPQKPRKPHGKKRGRPAGSKNRPKPQPLFTETSGPVTSGPVPSTGGPVSSIELLVEQIVQERTAELAARLAEAERKLADAKKLLS